MEHPERELIIHHSPTQIWMAVKSGDRLEHLEVENHVAKSRVGQIVKAKVARVIPGIQAAFINIGGDKAAFLYVADVLDYTKLSQWLQSKEPLDLSENRRIDHQLPIESLIKQGQQIYVQITKDPIGTKGCRVTMLMTLAGKYLVLMPWVDTVAVSKRIEEDEEKEALLQWAKGKKPASHGVIVRTAAAYVDREALEKDLESLVQKWSDIENRGKASDAPTLLYEEPHFVTRNLRDMLSFQIKKVSVDDPSMAQIVDEYLNQTLNAKVQVASYKEPLPIFDHFGLRDQIAQLCQAKVWLPSGGYVVIQETEALTSFDVNTGKFVGKRSAQDTIYQINQEACLVICEQLLLRNIGGIVVIDFIDMKDLSHRSSLTDFFKSCLAKDRAKTNVLAINELGLLQLTRKRTSESLDHILSDPCPFCEGGGRVPSLDAKANDLYRALARKIAFSPRERVSVEVNEKLALHLEKSEAKITRFIESRLNIQLTVIPVGPGSGPYRIRDD